MPNRVELSEEEWQTFYGLLLLNPRVYIGSLETCGYFLNAVFLWILRSGGQWHIALNLIKTEKTSKVGVKIKRLKVGWDNDYLLRVIGII